MNTSHHFPGRIAAAGLPVEVARAPLFGGRSSVGAEIVQLDIRRDRRRGERFQIWPGAQTNRIEAEGIDRELHQLVLLVHEPARRFEVEVSPWVQLAPGARVVRSVGRRRWIEQWTNPSKRHLCPGSGSRPWPLPGVLFRLPGGQPTSQRMHSLPCGPSPGW